MNPMQENPMQSIVAVKESRHLHNVIIFSGVRISRMGLRVCLEDLVVLSLRLLFQGRAKSATI